MSYIVTYLVERVLRMLLLMLREMIMRLFLRISSGSFMLTSVTMFLSLAVARKTLNAQRNNIWKSLIRR